MTWESEQGLVYEVPKFVLFLVKKGILQDSSWHNNTAPSFGVYDEKTDKSVVLWTDHPIKDRRENMGARFMVQVGDEMEAEVDDLQTALERLFKELQKFYGPVRQGPKEWSPRGSSYYAQEWHARIQKLLPQYSEEAASDWSYFLTELLTEFYRHHN